MQTQGSIPIRDIQMKLLAILLFILPSTVTLAQPKTVSLEAGFRYNLPARLFNKELSKFDEQKSGFGFELMPKWNLSNTQSIGINLGFNLILEDAKTDDIGTFKILSYLPTFKHKLLVSKFSPFYSVGFGGYSVLNSQTPLAPGLSLTLGISMFRKCSLSLEYDKILAKIKVDEDVFNGFDNWYFVGIKFSYDIGIKKIE